MTTASGHRHDGVPHLNQADLARRWRMSGRTLERWRWQKVGPQYFRAGGRVLYRLQDILAYEAANLRAPRQISDPFFQKVR